MIREIVTDTFSLNQKSALAVYEDLSVVEDLLDTIKYHKDECIGIAANMIGINKRIIVVKDQENYLVMLNPDIVKTAGKLYHAEESCLCHSGSRAAKRYEKIKVAYFDEKFKKKIKTFNGLTAQIIQHEIDHCQGILI